MVQSGRPDVLRVRADRALVRAEARSRRFLQIDIQAPEAPRRGSRLPVNLAFTLDRSGSMDGQKIVFAREAVVAGIRALREGDRFAVVAWDDQIDTVVASTPATPPARAAAAAAVARIRARNSTNLCGGWQRACDEVAGGLDERSLGRCLLVTDGHANVGVTDVDELVALAAAARSRGISTSTFGIGADFDEVLLRRMADAGGGNFQYIETAAQIPDFVSSEVGEALEIVAREAVLVIEAGEGIGLESLNGFACRQEGGAWRVELGSLYSGQVLQAVVRLTFPTGVEGEPVSVRVRVEDREHALAQAEASASFAWAAHGENDRQPRDGAVDRLVAQLYAAAAERDALERNRAGEFEAAGQLLERCARHVERYAGDDPELRALVAELRDKARQYSHDMDRLSRKLAYWDSHSTLKGRLRRKTQAPVVALLPAVADLDGAVELAARHVAAADSVPFARLDVTDGLRAAATSLDMLHPSDESLLVDGCRRLAPDALVRIAFTRQRLSDNWFSHWHERERTAVVSLAGWDRRYQVSVEAFVAYEIVLHGLRVLGPAWSPERLMHEESRGCLFDFCGDRDDVVRKLQSLGLCRPCHEALHREGLAVDRVLRLAGAIQALAQPAGVVH